MTMQLLRRPLLAAGLALVSVCAAAAGKPASIDPALQSAIDSSARTPDFAKRDSARHPGPELTFFGLTPSQTVLELWPGGGYWTEIMGPYLASQGHYYVALPAPGDAEEDKVAAK